VQAQPCARDYPDHFASAFLRTLAARARRKEDSLRAFKRLLQLFDLGGFDVSRDHFDAISETGATPQLLDIESAKVEELQQAFEGSKLALMAPSSSTLRVRSFGPLPPAPAAKRTPCDHRQPETPAVQAQPCARDYPDPARTLLYRSLTLSVPQTRDGES
jgi:hypothetical protein